MESETDSWTALRTAVRRVDKQLRDQSGDVAKQALDLDRGFESSQLELLADRQKSLKESAAIDLQIEALEAKKHTMKLAIQGSAASTEQLLEQRNVRAQELKELEAKEKERLAQIRDPKYVFLRGIALRPAVISNITSFLNMKELNRLEIVSSTVKTAISKSLGWKNFAKTHYPTLEKDDSHLFHRHFLFGMKFDPKASTACVINVEEVMAPNAEADCSNYFLKMRKLWKDPKADAKSPSPGPPGASPSPSREEGGSFLSALTGFGLPRMSSAKPSTQAVQIELCSKNPPKTLAMEYNFCEAAIKNHRSNLKTDILIESTMKKLDQIESVKTNLSMEMFNFDQIVEVSSKTLADIRIQHASDTHTILFLEEARDKNAKALAESIEAISKITKEKKELEETKGSLLKTLQEKKGTLESSQVDLREQLKKQIVILANEVKTHRMELEILQKEEESFKDAIAAMKARLES